MRKRPGVAGLKKTAEQKKVFKERGQVLTETKLSQMGDQLKIFKENLERFAQKYKQQINKDPELRKHFNDMCVKINVDPLASQKGFWAELLGIGDFYYELGIQIIEVCIKARAENGGLMDLDDLLQRIIKAKAQAISKDDIERAVDKLKTLGNGFQLLNIGNKKMVQSVPCELSSDHTTALGLAQDTAFITPSKLKQQLNWTEDRINVTLNLLLQEGMAWIDTQAKDEPQYWFPSIFSSLNKGIE